MNNSGTESAMRDANDYSIIKSCLNIFYGINGPKMIIAIRKSVEKYDYEKFLRSSKSLSFKTFKKK